MKKMSPTQKQKISKKWENPSEKMKRSMTALISESDFIMMKRR